MPEPQTVAWAPEQVVTLVLLPEILLLGVGLIVAQILASIARSKVGPVLAADHRAARRRTALLAVALVGTAAWIALDRSVWFAPVILCCGSALLLAFVSPSTSTAVLGERGVQRGWHARRFESLEEWRLTGDHLRFRLFGEWTAVPCPPQRQVALRAKLLELVPERESPFQD